MNASLFSLFSLIFLISFSACSSEDSGFVDIGISGDGGALNSSYSRILAIGDYLYAVDQTSIITYDISNRDNPAQVDRTDIGFDIETIYHHAGNLFIGSRTAMFTYTIAANGLPVRRGLFDYTSLPGLIQPCDPIVADSTTAYATLYTNLQGDNPCGRFQEVESLVIMDITNIDQPTLIDQLDMPTPRGLSIDGNLLFVCNDAFGITVMDIRNPANAFQRSQVGGFSAWDAIASNGLLVVVGPTEVIQFDYSNPNNLVELSRIAMPRT